MTTAKKATNIRATIDATWGSGEGKLQLDDIFQDDPAKSRPLTGSTLLRDKSLLVTSTFDNSSFFISKLNHLGAVDLAFGVEGRVMGSFLANELASGGPIAEGADGRLFMAGSTTNGKSSEVSPAILCLDSKGNRVSSFGDNGQVIIDPPNTQRLTKKGPAFVFALPDGSIIVGVDYHTPDVLRAHLYKFDAQGAPVKAFGTDGRVEIKHRLRHASTSLSDGCVLDNGLLLFAGYEKYEPDVNTDGLVVMLNSDSGAPHENFGHPERPGILVVRYNSRGAELNTVRQRAPNRFTASGYTNMGNALSERYGMLIAFDEEGKPDFDVFGSPNIMPLPADLGSDRRVNWADHVPFADNIVVSGGDEKGNYIACVKARSGGYNSDFSDAGGVIPREETTDSLSRLHYQQDPGKLIVALNINPENPLGCLYRYNISQ
ncbi:hypothetical protein [Pseudomonas sp. Sample_23]|jgi:hypothetical protein|uniref:hypothetical protein n=1 Tax=Pseudomonas sp. Sample_23 TaxID=2448267 RepID=UPI001032822D|nr:hypothetical protein [Pseudomonas sp. Sample_23]